MNYKEIIKNATIILAFFIAIKLTKPMIYKYMRPKLYLLKVGDNICMRYDSNCKLSNDKQVLKVKCKEAVASISKATQKKGSTSPFLKYRYIENPKFFRVRQADYQDTTYEVKITFGKRGAGLTLRDCKNESYIEAIRDIKEFLH